MTGRSGSDITIAPAGIALADSHGSSGVVGRAIASLPFSTAVRSATALCGESTLLNSMSGVGANT